MQILRKTTGIALSLIGAIGLGIKSADAIHVGVSPPRFEVKIDKKSRSQTIKIVNLDKKPVMMKAFVRSWTINKDGDMEIVQSTEQTLDQWIVFTPSQFTIPAGSSQTVRFAIRPKVEPKPGEHRAVLYLQEVPSQASQTESSNSVTTVGRLGIIIYAYAGEIKRVGALNSVNVDAKPNG
ncbi:MAG: fimbria/pilus periplasmic chaperone, partial [Rivularia sp. (in: cyanobacteria)]